MELLQLAQSELSRSNADRKHPFRFFWLTTSGDFPEVRTVVNRGVGTDLSVLLFTDARSPKVDQIHNSPKVSALFYHPKRMLQVRMRALAHLIGPEDGEYGDLLERVRQSASIQDYTTLVPPGSVLSAGSVPEFGKEVHFMAIRLVPAELDVLLLSREGHQRSLYQRDGSGWTEIRLVP